MSQVKRRRDRLYYPARDHGFFPGYRPSLATFRRQREQLCSIEEHDGETRDEPSSPS